MLRSRLPRMMTTNQKSVLHPGGCSNARFVSFASSTCARATDEGKRLRLLGLCAARTGLSTEEVAVLLGVESGPERMRDAARFMLACH